VLDAVRDGTDAEVNLLAHADNDVGDRGMTRRRP
jgi:hypothetical protein